MMLRLVTSFAIAAGLAASAMAQTAGTTNMEILRQKIKADKKLVVAENLKLTDAEATAFWPVYDAYQKDLQAINQRLTTAILAYADAYNKGPVTNETARKLLDESLAIDEAEAKLKSASAPKTWPHSPRRRRHATSRSKTRFGLSYATSWPQVFRSSSSGQSPGIGDQDASRAELSPQRHPE
jgi:hypothetical protein